MRREKGGKTGSKGQEMIESDTGGRRARYSAVKLDSLTKQKAREGEVGGGKKLRMRVGKQQ